MYAFWLILTPEIPPNSVCNGIRIEYLQTGPGFAFDFVKNEKGPKNAVFRYYKALFYTFFSFCFQTRISSLSSMVKPF